MTKIANILSAKITWKQMFWAMFLIWGITFAIAIFLAGMLGVCQYGF
jgi:hypothetical protein